MTRTRHDFPTFARPSSVCCFILVYLFRVNFFNFLVDPPPSTCRIIFGWVDLISLRTVFFPKSKGSRILAI